MTAAQAVLDAQAKYPTARRVNLYDPSARPAPPLEAHQDLDRAVDRCYRPEPFPGDRHRVEYLFALYDKLTTPLIVAAVGSWRKGAGLTFLPARAKQEAERNAVAE